jgi:hypothetical protein
MNNSPLLHQITPPFISNPSLICYMGTNQLLIIFFAFIITLPMKSMSSESYNQFSSFPILDIDALKICDGAFGECIHEGMNRRNLAGRGRYISYDALKKDSAPCKRRGNSYYGCGGSGQANPYRRGCTKVTHCARDTS